MGEGREVHRFSAHAPVVPSAAFPPSPACKSNPTQWIITPERRGQGREGKGERVKLDKEKKGSHPMRAIKYPLVSPQSSWRLRTLAPGWESCHDVPPRNGACSPIGSRPGAYEPLRSHHWLSVALSFPPAWGTPSSPK